MALHAIPYAQLARREQGLIGDISRRGITGQSEYNYQPSGSLEDGASCWQWRMLRAKTLAVCLPAWFEATANGDVLVGREP